MRIRSPGARTGTHSLPCGRPMHRPPRIAGACRGEMDGAAPLALPELVPAELLDELLHIGRVVFRVRLQPFVLVGQVLPPEQPDLAGLLREQVLIPEAVHGGEVPSGRCPTRSPPGATPSAHAPPALGRPRPPPIRAASSSTRSSAL